MNSPDPTDEKIAALLRASAHDSLPDDGFTARVTAALPPPRRAARFARRDWIIGGVTGALVIFLAPRGAAPDLASLSTQAGDALLYLLYGLLDEPAVLAMIALTVGALLYFESEEDSWPARPEN